MESALLIPTLRRRLGRICLALLLGANLLPAAVASGVVTGAVSNGLTGKMLDGAVVAVPALGRTEITDETGRYTLRALPPGEHTLVVSYTGLDEVRATVVIASDRPATRDFELTSAVYRLGQFVVTGEREGNAAAITRQRNAASVTNVASLDAFGHLNNDDPGDLLIRLPGISGFTDLDGNVSNVAIRGTDPSLNMVSVDGNLMSSNGGGRTFQLRSISGALFEEIEVTKAPTPEMSAGSIGGAVNFRTASSLDMKEKRRVTYRTAIRWAPPFFEHIPMRRDHPLHPLISAGYQEIFDVLGGSRNLGVTFNAFYSENVSGGSSPPRDYEFTTNPVGYTYLYGTRDTFNNRKQKSGQVRLDYRLSPNTTVFFGAILNEDNQPFNRQISSQASTGRTLATIGANGQPTGTGAIMPGYTSQFTQVRGVAASTFQLNSTLLAFVDRQAQVNVGAKRHYDRWRFDYDAGYNRSHARLVTGLGGDAGGGAFTMDVAGIGWTLDQRSGALTPTFTQTEGPSIYNGASYRNGLLTKRGTKRDMDVTSARANALYALPFSLPSSLKSGASYRRQENVNGAGDRRWNYIGTAPLSTYADPNLLTSDEARTGLKLPFPDAATIATDIQSNSANWREDAYYAATRPFIGRNRTIEEITAAYTQLQAKLGRLNALAGVRVERTAVTSAANIPARVLSTTAQRTANPQGAALADYDHWRTREGDYTNWFPGVYLTYNATKNLTARASWSNTIGRPGLGSLLPVETINTNAQTVQISNPALKPQYAENIDVAVSYYFEPIGLISAGYFTKDIKDFIVTGNLGIIGAGTNNGFNGDHAGYTLMSSTNGGFAKIKGWEFEYRQQLSFLPRPFSGLGFFSNLTLITTKGDYGTAVVQSTDEVENFVPRTGNVGLTYNYRRFAARAQVNYTGNYLITYSADRSRLIYGAPRTTTNAGFSYELSSKLTVFCDLQNLFNPPTYNYRLYRERPQRVYSYYSAISLGVKGRF
jgi:TonB-dependent receptor